jgi:NAD-dependent dihydropyrimidine dehydrogenase PreA subunit
MMGSGGLIVMDETSCMVDIAKYFLGFTVDESCGKCTPCRIGTKRLFELLEKVTSGKGEMCDFDMLDTLCHHIVTSSLCALGQTAPNPVLSTLNFFKDEYLAHIVDKKCPAGVCKDLLEYVVVPEKCIGCTICAKNCPVDCISGAVKTVHEIDQSKCIKCGVCEEKCKFAAIIRQ